MAPDARSGAPATAELPTRGRHPIAALEGKRAERHTSPIWVLPSGRNLGRLWLVGPAHPGPDPSGPEVPMTSQTKSIPEDAELGVAGRCSLEHHRRGPAWTCVGTPDQPARHGGPARPRCAPRHEGRALAHHDGRTASCAATILWNRSASPGIRTRTARSASSTCSCGPRATALGSTSSTKAGVSPRTARVTRIAGTKRSGA